MSHCKKRNHSVYCKKTGHIITECRLKPQRNDQSETNSRAYQAVADEPKQETGAGKAPSTDNHVSYQLPLQMKLIVGAKHGFISNFLRILCYWTV